MLFCAVAGLLFAFRRLFVYVSVYAFSDLFSSIFEMRKLIAVGPPIVTIEPRWAYIFPSNLFLEGTTLMVGAAAYKPAMLLPIAVWGRLLL